MEGHKNTHIKNVKKKQAYLCSNCDFPSDEIGVLQPCAHVFCLSCAALMSDCAMYVFVEHIIDVLRCFTMYMCSTAAPKRYRN